MMKGAQRTVKVQTKMIQTAIWLLTPLTRCLPLLRVEQRLSGAKRNVPQPERSALQRGNHPLKLALLD